MSNVSRVTNVKVMTNHYDLLQRSAQKDQVAFKRLYDETSPGLFSMTLRIVRRRSLAEEVLQEAYLKIWNRADSYNPSKASVFGWMSVITRNTALDKLRSLNSRLEEVYASYEGSNFASRGMSPEDRTEHDKQLNKVVEGLQAPHSEQRKCILFSYYYGYTHKELSEILGKPLGTVKGWIRRGSQQLLGGSWS